MGFICKNYGIFSEKLWDILCKNYGIYWAKTIGYIMRYIWLKLWEIFGKIWDIFGKNIGTYWAKTMLFYGIFLAKLWDILVYWIY